MNRLEQAYNAGRKSISIKQLCQELQMSRHDVLTWLKRADSMPERSAPQPLKRAGKAPGLAFGALIPCFCRCRVRNSVFAARRAAAEGLEGKKSSKQQQDMSKARPRPVSRQAGDAPDEAEANSGAGRVPALLCAIPDEMCHGTFVLFLKKNDVQCSCWSYYAHFGLICR